MQPKTHPEKTAFTARRYFNNPEQALAAALYEHPASGAQILDVQSKDSENLLSVLFHTPPENDTGMPHILEHAVLGGSRLYPVKDPFFHMLKMSLATFLNAMTGPDYTIYPCASNVKADFFNLAQVYLDAVFHPLLQPAHFQQEGFHLAFDPPDSQHGRLIVKGIVYNEMRGAYSSANEKMQRIIERGLLPDTLYKHDAGGDPDRITDLQYADLAAYHRRYYHPSNALIVHYGNIPPAEWMPFLGQRLSEFKPIPPVAPPAPQPRWKAPRSISDSYPIGDGESPSQRTYLALSWLLPHNPSPLDRMAVEALYAILLGHPGAPLYRALIESRLGHDLTHAYTHVFGREPTLNVGIKGSEAGRLEAFENLTVKTLKQCCRPGAIDAGMTETALTQIGYLFQEITDGFPLKLASQIYTEWLTGGDPFVWLDGKTVLDNLRARIRKEPRFFAGLIRRLLLDNPHRLTAVLEPEPGLGTRQEAAVAARLEQCRRKMTPDERLTILHAARELEALQQAEETAQDIAALPQLLVRDLPRRPQLIPTALVRNDATLTLLRNDIPSNGVNYLALAADLTACSLDDLRFFNAVYCSVALQMGAADGDYIATARRLAAHTGDMHLTILPTVRCDNPDQLVLRLVLTVKFLDHQSAGALALLRDLLFEPCYQDPDRLGDLLGQMREEHHSNVVENALSLAIPAACRHLGNLSALLDGIEGLSKLREVDRQCDDFAADPVRLPQRLQALSGHLLKTGPWTAAFTGSDQAASDFNAAWDGWMKTSAPVRPQPGNACRPESVSANPARRGLAAPMDVAFNVMSIPMPPVSDPDSTLMEIGAHLLSFDYLLNEIRFKGSAYGGGCLYHPEQGVAHLYSYRDPHIARTLQVFRALPAAARNVRWRQTEIDHGILGVARKNLRPLRPESANTTALKRHLRGINDQWLIERHGRLLAATPQAVKKALNHHLESALDRAGLCVVASRERLNGLANAPGEPCLEIENILESQP